MAIKLPDEVTNLLDLIEHGDRFKSDRLRKKLTAILEPENQEVTRLRTNQHKELLVLAHGVFEWCEELVNDASTGRIWKVLGPEKRLLIYWAKYFANQLLAVKDSSARAYLRVTPKIIADGRAVPVLWYEERHQGHSSHNTKISDAETLVQTVHPRFLKKLHEHLNGPHCLRWVIQDLKKHLPK